MEPGPLNVAKSAPKDTIKYVADCMQHLVTENDVTNTQSMHYKEYNLYCLFNRQHDPKQSGQMLTLFHSRGVPSIDLHAYLCRILKYCPCPNECFVALFIYFRRIADKCRQSRTAFSVDPYSVHRLIIAGIACGSKYFSDLFYTNSRYARVGGVHVDELNVLELEFLRLLGFELYVTPEELQETADLIARRGLPNLYATYPTSQLRIHTPPSPSTAGSTAYPSDVSMMATPSTRVATPGLVVQPPHAKFPNIVPSALVTPVTPTHATHSAYHGAPHYHPSLGQMAPLAAGPTKPVLQMVSASGSHGTSTVPTPTPPRTPPSVEDPRASSGRRPLPHEVRQGDDHGTAGHRHTSSLSTMIHNLFDHRHHHGHPSSQLAGQTHAAPATSGAHHPSHLYHKSCGSASAAQGPPTSATATYTAPPARAAWPDHLPSDSRSTLHGSAHPPPVTTSYMYTNPPQ
ncbi:cyclin-like protein interacting with PHO85 [Tieghemiomyces parasiticus]|uniref:Cyclin-like protein interacting with PHO85 n=1 Tax=Tieghemiomyces parasiticus TaxID=78921 RepID=A0A9W8DK12_9FUNG|nr:cyclin-like protein interacting with PHO85 [Tieghemiomyces parasiticus]